jgi:hypothetical protein
LVTAELALTARQGERLQTGVWLDANQGRVGLAGGSVHAMQWTEMAPPCRFDIAARTVMAAGRKEGGVKAQRDPSWWDAADATERHTHRRYEPR